ncbi:MAG: two-component sensor histidine kinase, partial [Chloroflexota bacterium]
MLERYAGRGALETIGNVMIGITFLLAIVATLLVYYFISTITDSIRRVTRGAKAIASGKLDYQIKVKSSDETGVLADAFNRMAARL